MKKACNKLGLSWKEFTQKFGVRYTAITKIESSVIKKPFVMIMAQIAKALGVSIEDLIANIMKKFTEITMKACQKNMCWNLTCTTCGSMDLMMLFTKVVFPNAKRALNRFSWNNPISYQEKMLNFFAKEINIKELHAKSYFPDWLGHIGLLLSSCKDAENNSKQLTKTLLPQFKEICIKDDKILDKIEYIFEQDLAITIGFLEEIENCLKYLNKN